MPTLALLRTERIETPLGVMLAGATDRALHLLEFLRPAGREEDQMAQLHRQLSVELEPGGNGITEQVGDELEAYFDGRIQAFTVPVELRGTPFQRQAWSTLREIPYGETRSYSQQAAAMGHPAAVRAVARANGANRIAIVVPCHRVIGADGSLTGYGAGLWRKERLLELERRNA